MGAEGDIADVYHGCVACAEFPSAGTAGMAVALGALVAHEEIEPDGFGCPSVAGSGPPIGRTRSAVDQPGRRPILRRGRLLRELRQGKRCTSRPAKSRSNRSSTPHVSR